jgi:antitoxin component YwqK of YwqJK toxin-antitoxin module
MQSYLLPDILQYVFNKYIDWENDSKKIIKAANFEFDIKPHIIIGKKFRKKNLHIRHTLIDMKISKKEEWYTDERYKDCYGEKYSESNYCNNLPVERKIWYYEHSGIKYKKLKDDNEFPQITKYYHDLNNKLIEVKNYKDFQRNEEQISYNYNGTIKTKLNYKSIFKDGVCSYYDLNGKLEKVELWTMGTLISSTDTNVISIDPYSLVSNSFLFGIENDKIE